MKQVANVLITLALVLVLLALACAAFTGYVAYCGMHKLNLDAFEEPPREDAARLGSVLEAGLSWAMRVCGAAVTVLGAALAARGQSLTQGLSSAVVILAGVVLISQHWAAGVALGVVAVAYVLGIPWRRPALPGTTPSGSNEPWQQLVPGLLDPPLPDPGDNP
jgi:hypothetical protein